MLQANLWINYAANDMAFMDRVKSSFAPKLGGIATEAWQLCQEESTGFFTRIPAGCTDVRTPITVHRPSWINNGGPDDQVYRLDWTGHATENTFTLAYVPAIVNGFTVVDSGTRYIDYKLTGDASPVCNMQIIQTAISATAGQHAKFRFYRKNNKTRLDGGYTFDPDFLAYATGYTSIRFMDWMNTNASNSRWFAHRPTTSRISYAAGIWKSSLWRGTLTGTDDWTMASAPAALTDPMQAKVATAPTKLTITAITKGASTTITVAETLPASAIVGRKLYIGSISASAPGFTGLSTSVVQIATVVDTHNFTVALNTSSGFGVFNTTNPSYIIVQPKITISSGPAAGTYEVNSEAGFLFASLVANGEYTFAYDSILGQLLVSHSQSGALGQGITGGIPLETICAFMSEADVDGWVTYPHLWAASDFTAAATILRDNQPAGKKVIHEYSNEWWNGQFVQSALLKSYGRATWGIPNNQSPEIQYGAMMAAKMASAVDAVYSGSGKSYETRLAMRAGQMFDASNAYYDAPAWLAANASEYNSICGVGGTPKGLVDKISIAPYMEGSGCRLWYWADYCYQWINGDAAQKETALVTAIEDMRTGGHTTVNGVVNPANRQAFTLHDMISTMFPYWNSKALGTKQNKCDMYEGLSGVYSGSIPTTSVGAAGSLGITFSDANGALRAAFLTELKQHPNFADLVTDYFEAWAGDGVTTTFANLEVPSVYALFGGPNFGTLGNSPYETSTFAAVKIALDSYKLVGSGAEPAPPTAIADSFGTTEFQTAITFDVLSNDIGTGLTRSNPTVTGGAAVGTVATSGALSLTFTPATGFEGAVTGTYRLNKAGSPSVTGTWSGTVLPEVPDEIPDVPTYVPLQLTARHGQAIDFNPLSLTPGNLTLVSIGVDASEGKLTDLGGGNWRFRGAGAFNGRALLPVSAHDDSNQIFSGDMVIDVTRTYRFGGVTV